MKDFFIKHKRMIIIYVVTILFHGIIFLPISWYASSKQERADNTIFKMVDVKEYIPPKEKEDDEIEIARQEKIAEDIMEVMKPDDETVFKICSGYVLSSIRKYLRKQGFRVEEIEVTGELQEMVERSFATWCKEVGIEFERLNGKRSFNTFLEWVAEKPQLREKLVKTGWKSWNQRWRERAYNMKP